MFLLDSNLLHSIEYFIYLICANKFRLLYIRNDSCKKNGRVQFKKKQLNLSYKKMTE